jgi:hypothetical protein
MSMPRAKTKKPRKPTARKKPPDTLPLNPLRTGMPALDSITGVEEFRKGKQVYRIIHTNEVDEYEETKTPGRRKKT